MYLLLLLLLQQDTFFSEMTGSILFKILNKGVNKIKRIFYDLHPKVKNQNQRANNSFWNKSWTAWSILFKIAPYYNQVKLNKNKK